MHIEKYKDIIVQKLNGNLEALVLVGSFARGEEIDSVSDIEFFAVVRDLQSTEKLKISEKNVTVGFTTRKHLARLKPYIFTVEVKKFGKVLWGERNILNCIPDYSLNDIDKKDALTLLNNRIVEQLILWKKIKSRNSIFLYDLIKGYIQIANSILAFHQRYRSLYPEKEEELNKLFAERNDFNKLFPGLKERIHLAFQAISNGSASKRIAESEALEKWEELRGHMKSVWNYENRIISSLYFLDNVKDFARAIMVRGIPRFLIYREAAREYFNSSPDEIRCADTVTKWEMFVK